MEKNNILPTLKVYFIGLIWWVWAFYQPFDWDEGALLVLISVAFYALYFKILIGNRSRLIYVVSTAPIFISISIVVVSIGWYLIAEAINA